MKLNAEEFENRFSKETVNISNKVRSNLEAFEYKIQKIETNIQDSIVKFQAQLAHVEKETLWKMQDYDRIIESRVNQDYVTTYVSK